MNKSSPRKFKHTDSGTLRDHQLVLIAAAPRPHRHPATADRRTQRSRIKAKDAARPRRVPRSTPSSESSTVCVPKVDAQLTAISRKDSAARLAPNSKLGAPRASSSTRPPPPRPQPRANAVVGQAVSSQICTSSGLRSASAPRCRASSPLPAWPTRPRFPSASLGTTMARRHAEHALAEPEPRLPGDKCKSTGR